MEGRDGRQEAGTQQGNRSGMKEEERLEKGEAWSTVVRKRTGEGEVMGVEERHGSGAKVGKVDEKSKGRGEKTVEGGRRVGEGAARIHSPPPG